MDLYLGMTGHWHRLPRGLGDLHKLPEHNHRHPSLGGPAGVGMGQRDTECPAPLSHSGILVLHPSILFYIL